MPEGMVCYTLSVWMIAIILARTYFGQVNRAQLLHERGIRGNRASIGRKSRRVSIWKKKVKGERQ